MNLAEWLALAAVCLGGAASPGPSLAVVTNASLAQGRIGGLTAAWAHAVGVGFYAAITVLGLGAIVTSTAWLFQGLQVAGAIYLLWLAWRLWTSGKTPPSVPDPEAADEQVGLNPAPDDSHQPATGVTQIAIDGFAIAFLNPKLAVFMFALLSQFINDELTTARSAILASTVLMIDGLWYSLVTLLLTRGEWLHKLRRNAHRIDRAFALVLTLLASVILWRL
ncbi:MAG: LysE family translocator [Congregibacter sp.]